MFTIFTDTVFEVEKARAFGFVQKEQKWFYTKEIMDGDFGIEVQVNGDEVSFHVFDKETGELYPHVHISDMKGAFVGEVRKACLAVLEEIRKNCFSRQQNWSEQALRLLEVIARKYGDELEFLWETSPHTAVLRHDHNQKWYAVVMKLDYGKLDPKSSGEVTVINLKNNQLSEWTNHPSVYPAFHMNKRYWLSLVLDDGQSDATVWELLEESWILTREK